MQRFSVFLSRSTLPSRPRGASNTVRRSRLGWPGAMRRHLSDVAPQQLPIPAAPREAL